MDFFSRITILENNCHTFQLQIREYESGRICSTICVDPLKTKYVRSTEYICHCDYSEKPRSIRFFYNGNELGRFSPEEFVKYTKFICKIGDIEKAPLLEPVEDSLHELIGIRYVTNKAFFLSLFGVIRNFISKFWYSIHLLNIGRIIS